MTAAKPGIYQNEIIGTNTSYLFGRGYQFVIFGEKVLRIGFGDNHSG
jgi:hypothetical protein